MRDTITRSLGRLQATFGSFTAGQKVVAVIGTIALALGGFMVFRWAAAPTYTPLFSNLAPADASAIVDQLTATGVPYEITGGGGTIMVPSDQVYDTRIALSGEGLPGASEEGGYHLLDGQSISTSQFQEQTSFKRAMEGELSATIESIDGVETAVVHLAIPAKEVFAEEQDPTTASVLVDTGASTLDQGQVQAVVNLVSASIDGLEHENVTVADSTGRVLTVPGGGGGAGAAQAQTQQVADFEAQRTSQVQAVLDRVFGAGNATAQVTAELNFDEQVTDTLRYFNRADTPLSSTTSEETLDGAGDPVGEDATGVVGPEGNVEPAAGTAGDGSSYTKKGGTSDMALDQERTHVVAAPGSVDALHVGVVVDTQALKGADLNLLQNNISAALGLDPQQDTIDVTSMAFSRTAEDAAAQQLEAAAAADKKAQTMSLARNGGLVLLLVLMVLVAWLQARRKAKARSEATSMVVEQLRREALERQSKQAALEAMQSPRFALEGPADDSMHIRDEIAALVERQPEDVAALLRGWLVEKA